MVIIWQIYAAPFSMWWSRFGCVPTVTMQIHSFFYSIIFISPIASCHALPHSPSYMSWFVLCAANSASLTIECYADRWCWWYDWLVWSHSNHPSLTKGVGCWSCERALSRINPSIHCCMPVGQKEHISWAILLICLLHVCISLHQSFARTLARSSFSIHRSSLIACMGMYIGMVWWWLW